MRESHINKKALVAAPCGRMNEKGKVEYPDVNCDQKCARCGWNPAEAERRMKTGKMKPHSAYISAANSLFTGKFKTLHFQKGV